MNRRRWPLLVIGASAGAATWSGWVGLGGLTGFGPLKPLPGILDNFTINTAITLPIGVEAYAVYALSVATGKDVPDRGRRFAWASSGGALLLGILGQVSYHVMESAGILHAPWLITALVSCVPVLTVGAASLLWHLAGTEDDGAPELAQIIHVVTEEVPEEATAAVLGEESGSAVETRPAAAVVALDKPRRSSVVKLAPQVTSVDDEQLLSKLRSAVDTGQLTTPLSGYAIRQHLGVGASRAGRLMAQMEG